MRLLREGNLNSWHLRPFCIKNKLSSSLAIPPSGLAKKKLHREEWKQSSKNPSYFQRERKVLFLGDYINSVRSVGCHS